MRRWIVGVALTMGVFAVSFTVSYVILTGVYSNVYAVPPAPDTGERYLLPAKEADNEPYQPINVSPIAATIGVVTSMATLAVWVGYRHPWGEATSTLLEQGLHDMTVRDVEIVGYIMGMKEFTIPELMKMTKASKITVWRTVQKLVEKGLVQQTEKTKLAAGGLGGRGKPSYIYRYVEPKK